MFMADKFCPVEIRYYKYRIPSTKHTQTSRWISAYCISELFVVSEADLNTSIHWSMVNPEYTILSLLDILKMCLHDVLPVSPVGREDWDLSSSELLTEVCRWVFCCVSSTDMTVLSTHITSMWSSAAVLKVRSLQGLMCRCSRHGLGLDFCDLDHFRYWLRDLKR